MSRKHSTHRRSRQYGKVNRLENSPQDGFLILLILAMDTVTGDIRAVELTSCSEGDSAVLPFLMTRIPPDEDTGTVTGENAFDTRRCHTAILDRGGTAIIPIRRNGWLWKEDCHAARARNDMPHALPGASVAHLEPMHSLSCRKPDRSEDDMPQILLARASPNAIQIVRPLDRRLGSGPID